MIHFTRNLPIVDWLEKGKRTKYENVKSMAHDLILIFLTIKIDEWWTGWYCTVLQWVKNVFVLNANNNSRDKVMTALRNVSLCTFFYCHYFIMWYLYSNTFFFFSLNMQQLNTARVCQLTCQITCLVGVCFRFMWITQHTTVIIKNSSEVFLLFISTLSIISMNI